MLFIPFIDKLTDHEIHNFRENSIKLLVIDQMFTAHLAQSVRPTVDTIWSAGIVPNYAIIIVVFRTVCDLTKYCAAIVPYSYAIATEPDLVTDGKQMQEAMLQLPRAK